MIINQRPAKKNPLKPSEAGVQKAIIEWAKINGGQKPALQLLFHIPNVRKELYERMHLGLEGVQSGVPDLLLPVARGGYFGLWIEVKNDAGSISTEQEVWLQCLSSQNYLAAVCYNAGQAIALLEWYVELDPTYLHVFVGEFPPPPDLKYVT